MKPLNFYLALFFVILPFSLFALAPNPNPKVNEKQNTIKVKEFIDAPIDKIEQKLGQKLKWHEKIAINSFKRKLKRQAKKNPNLLEKELTIKEIENKKVSAFSYVLIILVYLVLPVILIFFLFIVLYFRLWQ